MEGHKSMKEFTRPKIRNLKTGNQVTNEEKFQNEVIRPIAKLKYNLFECYFKKYLNEKNINLSELIKEQQEAKILTIFKKDNTLKADLRGLIIGVFTLKEYEYYISNSKNLNKRINFIIEKRITSTFI